MTGKVVTRFSLDYSWFNNIFTDMKELRWPAWPVCDTYDNAYTKRNYSDCKSYFFTSLIDLW